MFSGSSPYSDYVDTTFLLIVGLSTVVLLGIVVAMIYFVFKYSRKRNPSPTNIEGNLALELTWILVPLVLFMGMFYLGWEGYRKMTDIPEGSIPIHVTARMWSWTFEYPNGVTTDTLYVPARNPIKLTLQSADVNHSFYVPAFRIKIDVIPNRKNTMWFQTPRAESYDVACAEYCGLRHAYMYTKIVAEDSTDFEVWYQTISLIQGKTYTPISGWKSEKK